MEPGEDKEAANNTETTEPKVNVKLLNAAEAAFEIGVSKGDITRLREQGKLTGVRGTWGRWYYSLEALSAVIRDTPAPAPDAPPKPSRIPEFQSIVAIMNVLGPGPQPKEQSESPAEQAPLVRMANAILVQAIDSGASDIHLEPDLRNIRVRCRVDGIMHEIMKIPKHIQGPLIQRYKIMADINVLERRIPQAGTIRLSHGDRGYDLRVSTLPSPYGENVTMRILDKSWILPGLNKLGFDPVVQVSIEDMLSNCPSGLILIAGPGGSGITTTAYTLLHKINSVDKKIVTLEALPEYPLAGLAQSYYGGRSRASLSETLRLLPLMDVDTLFLGDINAAEAVTGAVEAALSGKQVIATMAAEDARMALWRLAQTGLFTETKSERIKAPSFLVSYPDYPASSERRGWPLQQTLLGILAQRLVRRICVNCRESYTASANELHVFGFRPDSRSEEVTLFRGRGCDSCRGSGYKGRLAIYELMLIKDEIAEIVARRAPLGDIKDAARANGMKEMRLDALAKILSGQTTPEEVTRALGRPKNSPL